VTSSDATGRSPSVRRIDITPSLEAPPRVLTTELLLYYSLVGFSRTWVHQPYVGGDTLICLDMASPTTRTSF
jgi:hypothetical protein